MFTALEKAFIKAKTEEENATEIAALDAKVVVLEASVETAQDDIVDLDARVTVLEGV